MKCITDNTLLKSLRYIFLNLKKKINGKKIMFTLSIKETREFLRGEFFYFGGILHYPLIAVFPKGVS